MLNWFWYLLEDVSEQPVVMKLFIAWGWLAVLIMLAALFLG